MPPVEIILDSVLPRMPLDVNHNRIRALISPIHGSAIQRSLYRALSALALPYDRANSSMAL